MVPFHRVGSEFHTPCFTSGSTTTLYGPSSIQWSVHNDPESVLVLVVTLVITESRPQYPKTWCDQDSDSFYESDDLLQCPGVRSPDHLTPLSLDLVRNGWYGSVSSNLLQDILDHILCSTSLQHPPLFFTGLIDYLFFTPSQLCLKRLNTETRLNRKCFFGPLFRFTQKTSRRNYLVLCLVVRE